jgi:hypothetical protein
MQMVRHEAVRYYCKLFLTRASPNLRQDQLDRRRRDEQALSAFRAETQGISMERVAGVRPQMFRMAGSHAVEAAREAPGRRRHL